jgi:ADP-heptose:LPS heptosyltransferase
MSARNVLSRAVAGMQHAWMGRPEQVLYFGCGLGDDVLCTSLAHELKKRGAKRIVVFSRFPGLFENSPDVAAVYPYGYPTLGRFRQWGYPQTIPRYGYYDPATDRDVTAPAHFIETMCRYVRLTGPIDLRTYLYLRPEEKQKGRLFPAQGVIHSAGLAAMRNKQWAPERYQAVADDLRDELRWVQLGMPEDPPIAGALDLRGKTTPRESAAIVANSKVLLGEAGFLMHLARAVDTRAVIVYGGREDAKISGYGANENIIGRTVCSPCWQRTRCDFEHECMRMIEPAEVASAVRRQLAREGTPLEVEQVDLGSGGEGPVERFIANLGNPHDGSMV